MSKTGANKSAAWLARVVVLVTLAAPSYAYGKAVAILESKEADLTITLYDENCALKDQITNLPKRAKWREGSKVFEGCWGTSERFGMVFLYFTDKTATGIPMPFFQPIVES